MGTHVSFIFRAYSTHALQDLKLKTFVTFVFPMGTHGVQGRKNSPQVRIQNLTKWCWREYHMGVEPKLGVGNYPQIIHLFIGFGTIINHPFSGTPIFGNTHIMLRLFCSDVTLLHMKNSTQQTCLEFFSRPAPVSYMPPPASIGTMDNLGLGYVLLEDAPG